MSKALNTLSAINEAAMKNYDDFVKGCEHTYSDALLGLTDIIINNPKDKIIMVAGPSASGKTTSACMLAKELMDKGVEAYTISLDDFYKGRDDVPRFKNGKPNFETVYALDLAEFSRCLNQLLTEKFSELPIFDFVNGRRSDETNYISLENNGVVIVEGLHALNPVITDNLPGENLLKVYISIASRIFDDEHNVLLTKRNMRFLRRAVRDYQFRNSSIENTYKLWESVQFGENEYLFPFKHLADIMVDSFHSYEPCIFKTIATALFQEVSVESEHYEECNNIIKILDKFVSIPSDIVPNDSLLREFIGR